MNLDNTKNELLIEVNRKIKEDGFEEYFNYLKKNEIFSILTLYMNSSTDVIEMYVLKDKSKRELIKYIKENLESIISINFNYIYEEDLELLKEITARIKNKEYDISDLNISLSLIKFFKRFYLAQFEYNSQSLSTYMPKKVNDLFLKLLKTKKAIDENHNTNVIMKYTIDVTSAYGIIDFKSLHTLFEKQAFKIEEEKLIKIIKDFENAYDLIHIYGDLVCSEYFVSEDMANDFYDKQKGEYKEFNPSDLKLFKDGKYIENSKSYKDFVNYLNDVFELSDEDISYITEFLVLNYIQLSSLSKKDADLQFKEKASEMFDLPDDEIEQIRLLTEKIYLENPKWENRGNI